MAQMLTALLLMLFLPPLLGAQEKVKFPVGVSSKVMNGIEKRRRNFWRSSFSLRRASPRKGWTYLTHQAWHPELEIEMDGLKTVVDIYAEQNGFKGRCRTMSIKATSGRR